VWIGGIEAIARKLGVRAVYDLSATPFFLRGSGYPDGTLFPWVVSDFSLIDAIESGAVVPGELELFSNVRDGTFSARPNTVTHILGVRAFGTQLLCEQVVGAGCAGERSQAPVRRSGPWSANASAFDRSGAHGGPPRVSKSHGAEVCGT
jgi:hypothetical protein